MSARNQSHSEIYGAPALERADLQLAICPNAGCHEPLEFTNDAIGRTRERCPKCDGVAPVRRIRTDEQRAVQSGLTNQSGVVEQILQLEARVAAQNRRIAKLEADEERLDWILAHHAVKYGHFALATRGDVDAMIGEDGSQPRDRDGRRIEKRMKPCPCGAEFEAKQGRRFCSDDCPARRVS